MTLFIYCFLQKYVLTIWGERGEESYGWVLIISGVLNPCSLHDSWYFSYMHCSINFEGNKSPLMTNLELCRNGPTCYPGGHLVWGRDCICPNLSFVSNFWQGGSASLVMPLGITAPLIISVTCSKGAYEVLSLVAKAPLITQVNFSKGAEHT